MIDIDLNQQVHYILEKEIIPVQIKFSYSEKEKKFDISPYTGSNVRERLDIFKYFSHKKTPNFIF